MLAKISLKSKLNIVFFSVLSLFAIAVFFIVHYESSTALKDVSKASLEMKIKGDIHASHIYLEKYFGSLSLVENRLVDQNGEGIENRFDLVDSIKHDLGSLATIFKVEGDDFIRVSTNIIKEDGNRAVGSLLGKKSSAYESMFAKELYIGEANILGQKYMTGYDPLLAPNGDLIGILFVGVPIDQIDKLIAEGQSHMTWSLLQISILIFILAIALLYVGMRVLFKPITEMNLVLKDISEGEGDLTKRIKVKGGDEIAEMANYFNQFVGKIHSLIGELVEEVETVAGSSSELLKASTVIDENGKGMSEQTQGVSETTNKISENVHFIAKSAVNMAESTNEVNTSVESLSSAISTVAQHCREELVIAGEAFEYVKESKSNVGQLTDILTSVGQVVSSISEIADQTKLLALNASIEAASAGEAGKGFAVVAGEVKELARQTALATEQIVDQVSEVRSKTDEAVGSIDKVFNVIQKVNELSRNIEVNINEQDEVIQSMMLRVNGVKESSTQVSTSVQESAESLSSIVEKVKLLNQVIQENTEGVSQIKNSTSELSSLSEKMSRLVDQFKI